MTTNSAGERPFKNPLAGQSGSLDELRASLTDDEVLELCRYWNWRCGFDSRHPFHTAEDGVRGCQERGCSETLVVTASHKPAGVGSGVIARIGRRRSAAIVAGG